MRPFDSVAEHTLCPSRNSVAEPTRGDGSSLILPRDALLHDYLKTNMQRPVQGGFPSPSLILDFEAMKSAHSEAVSSNEKTFPIFARKLASRDSKDFANTTHKLAIWLGSEKAYYPAARPKIVELLEIALSAFMDTFMHHSAIVEIAEQLRQLVHAVIPFRHLFIENELQSRLQRLILDTKLSLSRVSTSSTHGSAPPQGAFTADISSPALASPVHPQPTLPPVPGPQWSVGQIQPSLPVTSAVKAIPDGSVHDDTPRARDPSEVASSGQINAIPSLASPSMNTLQEPGEIIPSTIPPKPQPKRARRAELSEELIARDLDWFKSNQAVVNEGPSAYSSMANESSPALASDTPHIPRLSPSLKKKTARMVPSRRLPRRIPHDATQEVELAVSASVLPPSELPTEEIGYFENAENVQMDVDEQKPSLEGVNLDVRSAAIPEAHDVQDVPRKEGTPPEPQLVPTSSNEPQTGPEITQTDDQPSLVEAPFLNGESRISARPPVPPLETTLDRMESMDILTSDLRSEKSEPPSKLESTPPQSPGMLELRSPILPPLVNALEPPLNLNFRIPRISFDQPQRSEMGAIQRRFDDDMTVIHSAQGKPFTHAHMIDISLKEGSFSKISKWVNRKYHPSEAYQGVCISLACYRLSEFFDRIKSESGKHEIEELTSRSSCSWPYSNRLSLHVNDEERQTTIPLSPPLFLTPEQCVDISPRMKPGNNTLEIRQQDDLSEYLIVIHAHRPTRMQLAELDVVKTVDERWKCFLDAVSVRAAPGKTLDTTTADVVSIS